MQAPLVARHLQPMPVAIYQRRRTIYHRPLVLEIRIVRWVLTDRSLPILSTQGIRR